jgi:hypothetical protein
MSPAYRITMYSHDVKYTHIHYFRTGRIIIIIQSSLALPYNNIYNTIHNRCSPSPATTTTCTVLPYPQPSTLKSPTLTRSRRPYPISHTPFPNHPKLNTNKPILPLTPGKERRGKHSKTQPITHSSFLIPPSHTDTTYLPTNLRKDTHSHPSTYDHTHWRTRDPVRSPIDKPVRARLVVRSVTTSESLVLYVFCVSVLFFLFLDTRMFCNILQLSTSTPFLLGVDPPPPFYHSAGTVECVSFFAYIRANTDAESFLSPPFPSSSTPPSPGKCVVERAACPHILSGLHLATTYV